MRVSYWFRTLLGVVGFEGVLWGFRVVQATGLKRLKRGWHLQVLQSESKILPRRNQRDASRRKKYTEGQRFLSINKLREFCKCDMNKYKDSKKKIPNPLENWKRQKIFHQKNRWNHRSQLHERHLPHCMQQGINDHSIMRPNRD